MADLFVSYSRSDAEPVRRLCEALAARQREVWVDWDDIPPSAQWRDEIRAAIDSASAVVFVISPASVGSGECRRELEHAVAHGKRLVPVVLQKPDMAAVPAILAELNWIFLHADDAAAGVDQLLQAVDTDLAWSRAHAELLRRAIAWQAAERDTSKLLRGKDLVEAERALATAASAPKPVAVQHSFVRTSRAAAVRGQRGRLGVAIGVAIVAIGLSIWAVLERRVAQRRYQEALSRQLTIESNTVRDSAPDRLILSVQLAAEAMRRLPSPEAEDALRAGLKLLPRLRWQALLPTRTGIGVAFTPDGAHIATADAVWDARGGATTVELDHDGRTTRFAMSDDGRMIARIGTRRDVQLWDRASGKQRALEATPARLPFEALAFSRDDRWVAGADLQHWVHVWATADGSLAQSLPPVEPTLSGPVRAIEFDPGGGVIAIARRQRVERWETLSWHRLESALNMESGAIAAIDYAADGRLAIVSSAGEVVVHRADDTTSVSFRVPSELGRPESLRFGPGGRHLAVVTTVAAQVFATEDGKPVVPLVSGSVLAFAPDGTRIAVGGSDRTARVIGLADGRELARMVHGAGVAALAFSPDGTTLASMSDDGKLRLWDAGSAFPRAELRGTTGAFVDGGQELLATGEHQPAELWRREDRRTLRLPPDGPTRRSVVSADGTRLAAVTGDVLLLWPLPGAGEAVRIAHVPAIDWEAVRRREVEERGGALRAVASRLATLRDEGSLDIAAMSGNGRCVVTTRIDEIARLWDGTNGKLLAEIPYRVEMHASFSRDGTRVALATAPGVQLRDAASGRAIAEIEVNGRVGEVLLGHDGRRLMVLHGDRATLWDVDAVRPLATIEEVGGISLAPDGRVFATEAGNVARLWDAATGKVLAEMSCQCRIREIVFSQDGRRAAAVADDNRVYVRSTAPGGAARDVEYSGRIDLVAFSPDGRLLAMTGNDPIMTETMDRPGQPRDTGHNEPWQQLVEIDSGREIELERERGEGSALVFSRDARYLASGKVVWDVTTGRRLARAEGQILAFSPDGSLLVTREGQFLHAWPWRSEDMLALACGQLTDDLSDQEWKDYVSRDEPPAKTCAGLR